MERSLSLVSEANGHGKKVAEVASNPIARQREEACILSFIHLWVGKGAFKAIFTSALGRRRRRLRRY